MSSYTNLNKKTVRQKIMEIVSDHELTAREISQTIGIREKEVYTHLPHIARSTAAHNRKLIVQPARCLACGYVFKDRKRFTRPSRCPRCKHSHLQEPTYHIA